MDKEQLTAYRSLKKDYIAFLEGDVEIEVWSDPGMLVKLAMIASGLETIDPTHKPTGKFKRLQSFLEDRPGQHFIVGHFQSTINASARAAQLAGRSVARVHGDISTPHRREAIRAFQRGDIDVLCASIGTVAEGMTLHQAGCHSVVRIERAWTPSKNDQVVRRLHRIGQQHPVLVTDFVTPNSLDERVLKLLAAKSDQQMQALSASEVRDLL